MPGTIDIALSPTQRSQSLNQNYQKILLDASAPNDVKYIYWFIDSEFIAKVEPKKRLFFTPCQGKHRIQCLDDKGRGSSVVINVCER
ncbi:MAG: hypothetical protein AB1567_09355 [bacterium]